jgi:hypothetical protein
VKDDKEFGKPYSNSKKNEIGIFSKTFGDGELKLKVTSRGSVTVMEEVRPDSVIEIVQKELKPFMHTAPRRRYRK